ncbi:MAG: anthranilate phosphoribosyltransferase [Phycisphaeraceae bacterium]|nr:MAG: anthranilate phosphoribosyltransferase [Phycisphaeraceae bacterium]
MDDAFNIHATLKRLVSGERLGEADAEALFEALLNGELDEAQIGAVIALIQCRGANIDELVGAARAMRRHVMPVHVPLEPDEVLLDTCGTGGATKTFNISTATAFVLAAVEPCPGSGLTRVLVAKHGNRSRTGRGSAEILAALGVNVEASPEVQARCLREAGVCFSFAMRHHPAMRHAVGARRSVGFPTIFNLLGPLTNPAGADHQLLGVYHPDLVSVIAGALARLGSVRAVVVHGAGGLDECSTLGPNRVAWIEEGKVREDEIDPASLGVVPPSIQSIQAEGLDHGVRLISDVLAGRPGPAAEIVRLNAAVACVVSRAAAALQEGWDRADEAIGSGRARGVLKALARESQA